MRMVWMAVAAAVATMANSTTAHAARWVEYTLTGNGVVNTVDQNRPGSARAEQADFTATVTINVEQGSGFEGGTTYSTIGNVYTGQTVIMGVLQSSTATFTSDTISASGSSRGPNVFVSLDASSPGGLRYLVGSGAVSQTAYGVTTGYSTRIVNGPAFFTFSYNVTGPAAAPEPATWAFMLIGFGMIGAGLRSRRRSTTITYA